MASNLNCMIFTPPVFDNSGVWSKGFFTITPDSFSELYGVKYIILMSPSTSEAFEVDYFAIPAGANSTKVDVYFKSYIKPIKGARVSQLLVAGTTTADVYNTVKFKAELVSTIPAAGFDVQTFEKFEPVTDLQSMKANLVKRYGTGVDISITLKT